MIKVDIEFCRITSVQLEFVQNTCHQLVEDPCALEVIALGSGQCMRPQKGAQEEHILGDVAPKGVAVERAIGQPSHERMFEATSHKFRIRIPQCVVQHVCLATSKLNLKQGGFRGWIIVDTWQIPDPYDASTKGLEAIRCVMAK